MQIAADKVRVNVQLIDARTDTHLWANTYDRTFDDAFTVEAEVANAVAQQLDAKLVQRIKSDRPTEDAAAYNAYLRGVGLEHGQANLSSEKEAAAAYAEAAALDPNFAVAWARLSLVRGLLYSNGVDRNANTAKAVKEAADRAMALRPDLGEAWLAQGSYRFRVLRDLSGALQAYREAQKYLPNNALVYDSMVHAEIRLGQWREAEAHVSRATELDPRNVRLWVGVADVSSSLRRWDEVMVALDRALEISPNDDETIADKAGYLIDEGRLDDAAKWLGRLSSDSTNSHVLNPRAWLAMYERKFDEALFWTELATKSIKPGEPLSYLNIWVLVHQGYFQEWAGHPDEARATFKRVIRAIGPAPASVAPGRETRSLLALAYAGLGDKSNALEQARQGVADFNGDAYHKPSTERYLAYVQALCGDVDGAMVSLRHLLEVPQGLVVSNLRYLPFWDPLRNDPRFQELLKHPPAVRY